MGTLHSVGFRLFAVILTVALPLAATMIYLWWQALQDGRAREVSLLQLRLEQVEHDIRDLWTQSEWIMSRMAKRPVFRTLSASACDDEMAVLREINAAFFGITLWDREGGLVCSSFPPRPGTPAPGPHRESFDKGLATDGLYLSDLFPGQITGLDLVTFTYPVKDGSGATTGLLSIPVRAEVFEKLLQAVVPGPGRIAGITDRKLRLVARYPVDERRRGESIAGVVGAATKAQAHKGALVSGGIDGVKRIVTRKTLDGIGWRVFVSADEEVLFAGLRRHLVQGISIFALVVAASFVLAFLIASGISRPLGNLVRVADAVARGDRSARVAISGSGEIARLAGELNRMLDALEKSESSLRGSEARLRAIFDTEPECVTVLGGDGYVRDKNAAGLRVLEADSLGELQDRPMIEHVLPEYRAAFEALHRRVMRGESGTLEFELVGLKGTRRWLETHAAPLRDGTGKVTDMLGITLDITERKRADTELRNLAERLKNTLESITDAFFTLDNEWRFTYLNGEAERQLRRTREDLLGNVLWEEFKEAVGSPSDRGYREAMRTMRSVEIEQYYEPLGKWFEARAYPSAEGLAVYFRDISERKRMEAELRASEDRYRKLAESSPDAIMIHQDYRIVYVNPAMVQLARASGVEDLLGKSSVSLLAPEQAASSRERSRLLYAGEPQPRVERVYLRLDGTPLDVEIAAAPLTYNGKPAAQVTVRDISVRKQAEKLLRASMTRARELSGRLLSAQEEERLRISRGLHDQIGQELTAIKIRLDMLAQSLPDPVQQARVLEIANASGETLQRVRQISVDLRPPQLDALGLAAAMRTHVERQADLGRTAIHFESDELPRMAGDIEIRCFRVAQEALNNVLRHSWASNAWVRLALQDGNLILTVRDDGVGFEAEEFRGRGPEQGGIGLLGMQERVALAGGTLDIRSQQAQGCTLIATFPLPTDAAGAA